MTQIEHPKHKHRRVLGRKIHINLPHWVVLFYGLAAALLLPWTIYLSISLPTHTVSEHWDIVWSGFDAFTILMLVSTAYFAAKRSLWVALTASALGTALFIDSWFDILTAKAGASELESVFLAVFIEIPVALISWHFAVQAIRQSLHTPSTSWAEARVWEPSNESDDNPADSKPDDLS